MIKHIFTSINDITRESVRKILIQDSHFKNLKEESIGKFEGNGDGFNCYYFINDYKVSVCNFSIGSIRARIDNIPVQNSAWTSLTLATEFARVAEIISR